MRRQIFATAMLAAASAAPAIAAPQSWQEYGPGTGVVRCESNDGRMNRCSLPGGGGRVVLERQHSRTACIEGRSWGQDRGGVWVDDGCRADFRVAGYGGGYNDGYYGGGYGNGGYNDGYGNGGYGQTFRCESNDGRTRQCNGNGRGRAELVKQLSRTACVEGRTWGSTATACGSRRAAVVNSRWAAGTAVAITVVGMAGPTMASVAFSAANPAMAAPANARRIPAPACNWCASCRAPPASRGAPGATAAMASGCRTGAARNSAATESLLHVRNRRLHGAGFVSR